MKYLRILASALALAITPAIAYSDGTYTWQINSNDHIGTLSYQVTGTRLVGSVAYSYTTDAVEGYQSGRHIVFFRVNAPANQIWEGYMSMTEQSVAGSFSHVGDNRSPWFGTRVPD